MVSSMSFAGKVITRGSVHRKFIEVPKRIRDFIPRGDYMITLAAMGTVVNTDTHSTE